jgi:hypothetical protein
MLGFCPTQRVPMAGQNCARAEWRRSCSIIEKTLCSGHENGVVHLDTLWIWCPTEVFGLKQIAECDAEIEQQLTALAAQQPAPSTTLAAPRRKTISKHAPTFDIQSPLHRLTGGADLSQIDAIGPQAALQLIAEIGTDMSRWRSDKHFTS